MTTLVRIHTETGSYIDPPLDPQWDDATKLAWHAAVTAFDTGLTVEIGGHPGQYDLHIGTTRVGSLTYHEAWTYLGGVTTGAQQAQRLARLANRTPTPGVTEYNHRDLEDDQRDGT